MQPDILLLEEVSSALNNQRLQEMLAGPGYQVIHRVNTLDVNYRPSTKDLVALHRNMPGVTGRALRLPNLSSRRMLLKIVCPPQPPRPQIWVVHANASDLGGRLAINAAIRYIQSNPNNLIGGDFNRGIPLNSPLHPLSYENTPLRFSQWRKEGGALDYPAGLAGLPELHLNVLGCEEFRYIHPIPNPSGVIDYVVAGANCVVQPLPNCPDQNMWVDILRYFDHCPVLYQVVP
jgi:hypothetical protein